MTFSAPQNTRPQAPELSPSQCGGDVGVIHQTVIDFTRRPQVPYWPTTKLTRDQLAGAMRVAEQQDEIVLAIFRASDGPLSPSQVWQQGIEHGRHWLLTSVRRSITNLANADVLVHLSGHRMGPYGRPEGLWALPVRGQAA